MRITHSLRRLIGASDQDQDCPNEADVLAYSESKLSSRDRSQFERHFASCADCRHLLALLGRESAETPEPLTEEAVSQQTDRVLAYIQRDELSTKRPAQKPRPAAGFYISFPRLASAGLAISAVAVAGIFMIMRDQSPPDTAMEALRLGLKNGRLTQARISGGLEHSRYLGTTRGGDNNDEDLHFNRAENKLKAAREETASVDDTLMLARICIARGTREEAKRALEILNQLASRGVETPEALNDTGVAYLQLDNYAEAINYFRKALEKFPAYHEALFNRALAEERAHRDDDARRDWQLYIDQTPDDRWKAEARTHLNSLGDASPN